MAEPGINQDSGNQKVWKSIPIFYSITFAT